MCTQFIELEMALQPLTEMIPAIEKQLETHGEPLRWAITQVQGEQVIVEAAVLVHQS